MLAKLLNQLHVLLFYFTDAIYHDGSLVDFRAARPQLVNLLHEGRVFKLNFIGVDVQRVIDVGFGLFLVKLHRRCKNAVFLRLRLL